MEDEYKDCFIGVIDKEIWEDMLKRFKAKRLVMNDNENLEK